MALLMAIMTLAEKAAGGGDPLGYFMLGYMLGNFHLLSPIIENLCHG